VLKRLVFPLNVYCSGQGIKLRATPSIWITVTEHLCTYAMPESIFADLFGALSVPEWESCDLDSRDAT
jgi:hypothetical protein